MAIGVTIVSAPCTTIAAAVRVAPRVGDVPDMVIVVTTAGRTSCQRAVYEAGKGKVTPMADRSSRSGCCRVG